MKKQIIAVVGVGVLLAVVLFFYTLSLRKSVTETIIGTGTPAALWQIVSTKCGDSELNAQVSPATSTPKQIIITCVAK